MGFNPFEMGVQLFQTASNFPNSDGPNAFFPNKISSAADFRWPLRVKSKDKSYKGNIEVSC